MQPKGELIIHIGPPKTATTSLQHFFQNLNNPKIIYDGIFQPRKEKNNFTCQEIHREILNNEFKKQSRYVTKYKRLINNGMYVIVSEEMFSVNSSGISWQDKLERLAIYFEELEPTILFTIREPKDVIPSYYQEIYYYLKYTLQDDLNAFAKSSYCEIYDYCFLYEFLKELNVKKLKILSFDKLIAGEYTLSDILPLANDVPVKLKLKNNSFKKPKRRFAKNATVGKIVLNKFGFLKQNNIFRLVTRSRIVKQFLSKLLNIKVKKGKKIDKKIDAITLLHYQTSYERFHEKFVNK
jgi:hypothetical protein